MPKRMTDGDFVLSDLELELMSSLTGIEFITVEGGITEYGQTAPNQFLNPLF